MMYAYCSSQKREVNKVVYECSIQREFHTALAALKYFLPVWFHIWNIQYPFQVKVLSQFLHTRFFSSVCCQMAKWTLVPMNTLLHCQITYKATILRYNIFTIVQWNVFSTLCVLRWYKITIMRRKKS